MPVMSTGASSGCPSQKARSARHDAQPAQLRQQQREHEAPDRVIEDARGQALPRSRLARAARLRALELRHPQLEDPARVLLRLVGAEEHALLAPPVEDREIGLRNESAPAARRAGGGGTRRRAPRRRSSVRPSSVMVSHTSTCLATRIVSAGVTKTIAAAMNAPKNAHRPIVTMGERPNDATRSVRPG